MGTMYDRILGLCEERGVKPGRVCADTGLSRGVMSDLKMGRTKELSAKNTKIIADYFGVTTDYLLGTETEKAPTPEGERIRDEDIMAAFFRGADPTLTEEEMGALWDDARSYMEYKLAQRGQKRKDV